MNEIKFKVRWWVTPLIDAVNWWIWPFCSEPQRASISWWLLQLIQRHGLGVVK